MGNPNYIIEASMSIDNFHRSLASGDIVIYAGQSTVGFRKQMTQEHYPGITLRGTELNEAGADILEKVYMQNPNLRPQAQGF